MAPKQMPKKLNLPGDFFHLYINTVLINHDCFLLFKEQHTTNSLTQPRLFTFLRNKTFFFSQPDANLVKRPDTQKVTHLQYLSLLFFLACFVQRSAPAELDRSL